MTLKGIESKYSKILNVVYTSQKFAKQSKFELRKRKEFRNKVDKKLIDFTN